MVQVTTNLIVAGSIVPSAGYIYDLGSSANPWRDLYVSTGTIYLGPTGTINANAIGNVTVNNRNLLFDGTDSVINSSTVTVSTITTTTLSATNTMRVTNNITAGGMFIGTSGATIGKLTIQATASNFSTSGLGYVHTQSTALSTYPTGVNIKASMYANGDVWTGGNFIVSSDERVKKNVQNIDDFEALSDLRLIEPKKYQYVDYIQRGTNTVYGFLAQQVSSVFNDAVKFGSDFIPDYFQTISTVLSFDNNSTYIQCLNIPQNYLNSLSTSRLIKMYDGENKQVLGSVSSLQSNSFSIVSDQNDVETVSSCLFLFGKQVDDFQTLNKDYLFTLNFAATQEIDRILQSTNQKVELLENIVQSQQSTIQSLVSRL